MLLYIAASAFFVLGAILLAITDKVQLHFLINQTCVCGPLNPVFTYATYLGGEFIIFGLIIVLLLNVRLFFAATLAYAVSSGLTQLMKLVLFKGVLRPKAMFDNYFPELARKLQLVIETHGENSFPSGHTSSAFSFFFVLGLAAPNKWGKAACFLIALAIGFSRIYLSQHFFEDVYTGALIGIVFATLFMYIFYFAPWSGKMNKLDAPLLRILIRPKNDV